MNEGGTPENLVHFEKGESGNPKGRPKGRTLKSIFDELLDMTAKGKVLDAEEVKQLAAELGRKVTYREAFAIRTMAKAISNPESKSAERLADRTEGKAPQTIELTGELNNTLTVITRDEETKEALKKLR